MTLLFLASSLAAPYMPRGQKWRANRQVKCLETWRCASKKQLIVVVSSKIPANNDMLWVPCGRHPVILHHNTVSAYQHLWLGGKLIMCPLFAPFCKINGPSHHHASPGKGKKHHGDQLNCRVSLKFQVLLPILENLLRSTIAILLLLWHLSLPQEKRWKEGEIGKLHLSFKGEGRNCNSFVWASVTTALVVFCWYLLFAAWNCSSSFSFYLLYTIFVVG